MLQTLTPVTILYGAIVTSGDEDNDNAAVTTVMKLMRMMILNGSSTRSWRTSDHYNTRSAGRQMDQKKSRWRVETFTIPTQ